MKRVLIIGAGWAGLAAAVELTQAGQHATVLEAARAIGGRARALNVTQNDGKTITLDNGQHILIGAYAQTLQLLRTVGVDIEKMLLRIPLTLRYPDGGGLALPHWMRPWFAGADVAWGITKAKGWTLGDKLSLLRAADAWRRSGFTCPAHYTVRKLCLGISPRVMAQMIEPLVISALNTPCEHASAQVFLRILRDALFTTSAQGPGSHLLLPRTDLGQLLPASASDWLRARGAHIATGVRVNKLDFSDTAHVKLLQNQELLAHISQGLEADFYEKFDEIILATPARESVRILQESVASADNPDTAQWLQKASALQYEAITTVYAHSPSAKLAHPMLALHSSAQQPAQFVFDRGQLTGHHGILAFVVSASQGDANTLQQQVIRQGQDQLGLKDLQAIQTIVEKRATFACTPGLQRPGMRIAPRLWACGDYVEGAYPSTLEGAVLSGQAAAQACYSSRA